MTPRQADVAFVLESVPGVRAVYAIERDRFAHFEFAVEVDDIGALTAAHYALLRVLGNEECERINFFTTTLPAALARPAKRLTLDHAEREAARARVPPAEPRPRLDLGTDILVVDADPSTAALVRENFPGFRPFVATTAHDGGLLAKSSRTWCLVLLDARHAFGPSGVLCRLPLEHARRACVLAHDNEVSEARSRIADPNRVLTRPLSAAQLWSALVRTTSPVERVASARRIAAPRNGLRVLLVDVEGEFETALARICGVEIDVIAKSDVDDALAYAFSNPVSVILCGERVSQTFIDAITREDEAAARRIIVAAPASDLLRVRDHLASRLRRNRVIPLPLEEETLRAAVLASHPEIALPIGEPAPKIVRPAYRRLAVLVIDDDASTHILFSAGMHVDDADVALETTSLGAFEHVLSRPVDVLFVSMTMRSDGGEPFYRTLWRMKPELKARTVLIASAGAAPPSARDTKRPRILERPASRSAIAEIIDRYRRA